MSDFLIPVITPKSIFLVPSFLIPQRGSPDLVPAVLAKLADNVQSSDKISSIVFDLKDSLDPDARRVDGLIFVCRQQRCCVV